MHPQTNCLHRVVAQMNKKNYILKSNKMIKKEKKILNIIKLQKTLIYSQFPPFIFFSCSNTQFYFILLHF